MVFTFVSHKRPRCMVVPGRRTELLLSGRKAELSGPLEQSGLGAENHLGDIQFWLKYLRRRDMSVYPYLVKSQSLQLCIEVVRHDATPILINSAPSRIAENGEPPVLRSKLSRSYHPLANNAVNLFRSEGCL